VMWSVCHCAKQAKDKAGGEREGKSRAQDVSRQTTSISVRADCPLRRELVRLGLLGGEAGLGHTLQGSWKDVLMRRSCDSERTWWGPYG
jgi:hypothetical protein